MIHRTTDLAAAHCDRTGSGSDRWFTRGIQV